MIDRINLLLKAKNVTARQFAEEIGIQPSGMSHILSGRNRPSLDFVLKVINRYPEIDINWLMFGKGEMIAPSTVAVASQPATVAAPASQERKSAMQYEPPRELDLFSAMEADQSDEAKEKDGQSASSQMSQVPSHVVPTTLQEPQQEPSTSLHLSPTSPHELPVFPLEAGRSVSTQNRQLDENRVDGIGKPPAHENPVLGKKRIAKVVILYTDHSFSEYYPE